jgi:excisionase family DNA binding protein
MYTTLLDASQVAETLNIGVKKVYRMVQAQEIPSLQIGGSIRIPSQALFEWIQLRTTGVTVRQEERQQ